MRRITWKKTLLIAIPLLLVALFSVSVNAQNQGNPTILTAVNNLATQLTSISNQLTELITGTNTSTQLSTPMLISTNIGEARVLECRWVNVSSETITVTASIVEAFSGAVAESQTCTMEPGQQGCAATAFCGPPDFVCQAYCQFTGATAQQIRGSILLTGSPSGGTLAALAAQ
jgi:5-enolpyruvylshikimate-3-phosphate synthase